MATPIKVVLKEEVPTLGKGGDVVRVRPGYARNYLIPRGVAIIATPGNLARLDELKRASAATAQRQVQEAKVLAASLEAVCVRIERTVGEENKMFGSVTGRDIEEAFATAGLSIDRKKLSLPEPIKQLGSTSVPLRLHPEVTAVLRVEVVKKG
jgi:large subunit ribosomal protein L9